MSDLTSCALHSCANMKPATQYLCQRHWHALPFALQKDVNSAYSEYKRAATIESVKQLRVAQRAALANLTA
jgi:hypothetical protein